MLPKIKNKPLAALGYILLSLAIIFLFGIAISKFTELITFNSLEHPFFPNAAETAGAVTIHEGINEFNGEANDVRVFTKHSLYLGINIYLFFIFLPLLALYFLRKVKLNLGAAKPSLFLNLSTYLTILFIISYTGFLVGTLYGNIETFQRNKKANYEEGIKDVLNIKLFDVYAKAAELALFNKKEKIDGDILQQLNFKKDIGSNYFTLKSKDSSYEILCSDSEKDSTIKIYGVAISEGKNTNFKNLNGSKGRFQIYAVLDPLTDLRIIGQN